MLVPMFGTLGNRHATDRVFQWLQFSWRCPLRKGHISAPTARFRM